MDRKKHLFEEMPVPKALATLAVPTIISQLITMVYNLADTFFIGQTDDPYKVASTTLSFVLVFAMNALSNLFGVGGGTLVSRLLGKGRAEEAKKVSSFSVYGSLALGLLYGLVCLLFREPILGFLGASENTFAYASTYVDWVVILGGAPAVVSLSLSHLLRSEGYAGKASFGLGLGGVINIILDPLFMFVLLPEGNEVMGAAIATVLSNVVSLIYFLIVYRSLRGKTCLSLSVRYIRQGAAYWKEIMGTGIPSFLGAALACVSSMILNQHASEYGDVELAALGIVKKIDMLPLNVGMGLCQGMLPLVAYNYAAGNHKRMKKAIDTCRLAGMGFALLCIVIFQLFAPQIVSLFIREENTVRLGTSFLRICCLATPLMFYNLLATFSIQAMGKARESMVLSVCRQGLFNIPLQFAMNAAFHLYGVVWTQFLADSLTMIVSTYLFYKLLKEMRREVTL